MPQDSRIDLYIHLEPSPQVLTLLTQILTGVTKMSAELDALTAAVQRNSDAEDSAIRASKRLWTQRLRAATQQRSPRSQHRLVQRPMRWQQRIVANTPAAP